MTEAATEDLNNGAAVAPRTAVGLRLAAAREAKGMAVAKVAEKLKLTLRQVEALERDQYDSLPGPLFVRGFVRNYAKLVDLDPDALIGQMALVQKPTETLTAPSEGVRFGASPVRRWLVMPLLVFGLFMLLVAGLYAWLSQGEESLVATDPEAEVTSEGTVIELPVMPQPVPAVTPPPSVPAAPTPPTPIVPAETAAPAPGASGAANPVAPPPVPAAPAVAPVAAPAISAKTPGAAPVVVPVVAAPQPVSVAKPVAGGASIRFQAQEDSWIQVVDGSGTRFSELVRAGSARVMTGKPPFRMVIGNAAFVRMDYNNHAIDLKPFIGEKVARLTLE